MVSPGIEIPRGAKNVSFAEDGTISAQFQDSAEPLIIGSLRVVDFEIQLVCVLLEKLIRCYS